MPNSSMIELGIFKLPRGRNMIVFTPLAPGKQDTASDG